MEPAHPLPWPFVCRVIDRASRRGRHPMLASALAFGLPWNVAMAVFLALRWDSISLPALVAYFAGAFLWNLAPGFLYLHHLRHFPAFFAAANDVTQRPEEFQAAVERRRVRRLVRRLLGAAGLYAVALGMYWAITPFLFSQGGFEGYADPLFWTIFAAWMAWFGLMALPGLASIFASLGAVRDLAGTPLRLRPLHPDGVGGLGGVGRFIVQSTLGVSYACLFLPMALVALPAATARFALVLAIAFIVGLLVGAAAWPLHHVQRAAEQAKRTALAGLEEDYARLSGRLAGRGRKAAPADAGTAAVAQLRLQESSLLAQTPTVPISLGNWTRLALHALLPVAFSAAELLLKHRLGA